MHGIERKEEKGDKVSPGTYPWFSYVSSKNRLKVWNWKDEKQMGRGGKRRNSYVQKRDRIWRPKRP